MQEVCSLAHKISERKQGDKTNLDVLANLIYCLGNHRDPSLVDCCFVMSFVACWWLMEIKWWFGEVPTQRRGFGSNPFCQSCHMCECELWPAGVMPSLTLQTECELTYKFRNTSRLTALYHIKVKALKEFTRTELSACSRTCQHTISDSW